MKILTLLTTLLVASTLHAQETTELENREKEQLQELQGKWKLTVSYYGKNLIDLQELWEHGKRYFMEATLEIDGSTMRYKGSDPLSGVTWDKKKGFALLQSQKHKALQTTYMFKGNPHRSNLVYKLSGSTLIFASYEDWDSPLPPDFDFITDPDVSVSIFHKLPSSPMERQAARDKRKEQLTLLQGTWQLTGVSCGSKVRKPVEFNPEEDIVWKIDKNQIAYQFPGKDEVLEGTIRVQPKTNLESFDIERKRDNGTKISLPIAYKLNADELNVAFDRWSQPFGLNPTRYHLPYHFDKESDPSLETYSFQRVKE